MTAKLFHRHNILKDTPQLPVIVVGDVKYQVSFGGYLYSFSPVQIADKCVNLDDLLINMTSNGRANVMNIVRLNSVDNIVENKRIAKVGNDYFFKINDVLYQIV